MPRRSLALQKEIQQFLLGLYNIDNEDLRKQIARDADLPEALFNQITWGIQPTVAFVSHLIDRTLEWGSFSKQDPRHALVEYLRATQSLGGGQHQERLAELLERLRTELTIEPSEPSLPPEVKFVNREQDITELTDEASLSPRYAIHAPAGYGKTWLLGRLQYDFSRKGWLVAHSTLTQGTTILELTTSLLKSISTPEISEDISDIPVLAEQFAGNLKRQWETRKPGKGIVLLIDLEDLPTELPEFPVLIKDWLPVVTRNIQGLHFFASEQSRLRVIISGRFFDNETRVMLQTIDGPFTIYPLTPFSDAVLARSVSDYLPDLKPEWRTELWSTLFHLTGGHPGIVSKILHLYWSQNKPVPDRFFSRNTRRIQAMVRTEVNDMLSDIPNETRQLLLAISPYRYLSYEVIENILNYEHPIVAWTGDALTLADRLTQTYLVSWDEQTGHLLKDEISRRIMVLHLRYSEDVSPSLRARCIQAREIYKRRLADKEGTVPATRWAIEYLFESLQAAASDITTASGRARLRQSFWGTSDEGEKAPTVGSDLYECLSTLTSERDERMQIEAFQRALRGDWEFQFAVNYFLRDDVYSTNWFGLLLAKTRSFLAERSSSGEV